MPAVVIIDHDYTVPLEEWVASLPQGRPLMTADGYAALLRHLLSGGKVPFYTDPLALLADLNLARANEVGKLRDRLQFMSVTAARTAPAVDRIWQLVYSAGSRKTLQVADVRSALEEERG